MKKKLSFIYIHTYTTIATTVAIKQFIRPNRSELSLLRANRVRTYDIGNDVFHDTIQQLALILSILMENQWLGC